MGEPRMLGRYALHAQIASGGMASVHLGRLRGAAGFGRTVAIKRLHPHLSIDPAMVAMFIDEARLAVRIRHPNVVPTLDVILDEGEIFLVLEYVHGASLSSLLRGQADEGRRAPLDVVTAVVGGVLHGLHAAHEAVDARGTPLGMVHRDASPQNILIGTDGLARIGDFGIAHAQGRLQTTEDGQLKGKLAYMAPEQIRAEPVDRRTDVYAIGTVLWEALAGRRMRTGETRLALLRELGTSAEPLTAVVPDLPPALAAAVDRALAQDPADRFPSAHEMAVALEEAVAPAPPSRVGSWVARLAAPELERRARLVQAIEAEEENVQTQPGKRSPATPTPTPTPSAPSAPSDPAPPASTAARDGASPFAGRGLLLVLGAAAVVAGAVAAVWLWPDDEPPPGAIDPGPAGGAAVGLTDLPEPRSASPEALAAYRAGMQSLRDGATTVAMDELRTALAADPGLAEAHMRLGYLLLFASPDAAREHASRAGRLRSSMTERDRALLHGLEPLLLAEPSDYAQFERRMNEAARRYPTDAEIAYFVARARSHHAPIEAQIEDVGHVLSLDPAFTWARAALGELQLYAGHFDAARETVRACLARTPAAAQCLELRTSLDQHEGRCADVERDARRLLALDPASPSGYRALANALLALQRTEAARAALEQAWQRADMLRPNAEQVDRIALDALAGDFEGALAKAAALETTVEPSRVRRDHAEVARIVVALRAEVGDAEGAGRRARDYVDRRGGWVADPRREDFAMARDPVPAMARAAARGGAMTAAEAAAEQQAWLADWNDSVLPAYRSFVWPNGWADGVETEDEAGDALAALRPGEPLPPFRPMSAVGADVGRVFLLGGRTEEAITWLRAEAGACTVLDFPIAHPRAHLFPGQALERSGDHNGACAAYAVVLDRWGEARPRSTSAAAARERASALGCGE